MCNTYQKANFIPKTQVLLLNFKETKSALLLISTKDIIMSNNTKSIEYKGFKIGFNAELESVITQEMLDNSIAKLEANNDDIHSRAAMRPLHSTEIVAIHSPYIQTLGNAQNKLPLDSKEYKWYELIDTDQKQTNEDHGGGYIEILTETIGFSYRFAKMNGNDLDFHEYDIEYDVYYDNWYTKANSGLFRIEAHGMPNPSIPNGIASDSIFIA